VRLGILVDGEAEFRSLPLIVPKLSSPHTIVGVFRADIQPKSSTGQIVHAINKRRPILELRRADAFLILVDREDRPECAGTWASEILRGVNSANGTPACSGVVVKNRTFENWLLGDVDAIASMPKRFCLSDNEAKRIESGLADNMDAQAMIKRAAVRDAYEKVADSMRILDRADPLRIGRASRSFRKLLREVENPHYLNQSKVRGT